VNFLFPLYLAGALAVALPIYLHLRRKPPKDAVDFSSLMFLEPSKHQPIKRRSQLENLPLLLLRCLALLLLAAMFSRPFFAGGDQEDAAGQKRTVVLIDTSASMRRGELWGDAVTLAKEAIENVQAEGSLAVMTVGQTPRTLISFEDWRNADSSRRAEIATQAIDEISPEWTGSDLGSGMISAAEMIADAASDEDSSMPSEIIVISDLQSGAALDAIAEATWPGNLSVVLAPVEATATSNAAISAAASSDPDKPTVRVRNDPESATNNFEIRAGDQTISAVVPPGESRFFQLAAPASEIVLTGDGDGQEFDNRLFLAPREAATIKLQFIDNGKPDDSNGPEYYFRRAFGLSKVLNPSFVDDLGENPEILAIARALEAEEIARVRELLTAGGRALLVVTETGMAKTLGELVGGETPQLTEYEGKYSLLQNIDYDHPTLGEFRDPRWRDFTQVHFWKHREIDVAHLPEGSRVIAEFDSGAPAWIEIPVGEGSLSVMMSGWHPRDSQLSLSSKFIPLLFSIFSDAGPKVGGVRQYFVGDLLPIEDGQKQITLPSGKKSKLDPDVSFHPSEPGIYRVEGGTALAVNLRPSESELTPLGKEALVALGVPVGKPAESEPLSGNRVLRNQESEATQNLWRWAVIILLALLVVESWLGSRSSAIQLPTEATVS
jgi:hypothetical protein